MSDIVEIADVLLQMDLQSPSDSQRAVIHAAMNRAEGSVKRFLHYDPILKVHTQIYRGQALTTSSVFRDGQWTDGITQAIYREYGRDRREDLQLQHVPIRRTPTADAEPRVWIDSSARNDQSTSPFQTEAIEGETWWGNYDTEDDNGAWAAQDGVLRSISAWPIEPGGVKVTYWAGYTCDELRGLAYVFDASPIYDAILTEAVRRAKQSFIQLGGKISRGTEFAPGILSGERLGDYSYSIGGGGGAGSLSDRLYGSQYDLMSESKMMLESFVNYGWPVFS